MEYIEKEVLKYARPETKPIIPRKIRWKAKAFGNVHCMNYLWDYYKRESEDRVPFYLPSVFLKECMEYLCRYGKIPRREMDVILIDGGDFRIDEFLKEYLEDFHYVTIVTDRKEYFTGLQERAFSESGILIDLVHSWEEKRLQGNLVWDFSEKLQRQDCYPEGSICFLPCKKEWKQKEVLRAGHNLTVVSIKEVEAKGIKMLPSLAESLIVPKGISFRPSRCKKLREWCKIQKWTLRLKAQTLKNLDI